MGEWREMRWLRLHAISAPFGIFTVTVLLMIRSGEWSGWESLEPTASLVDLGAVLYGMAAVLIERGARMVFWALEQRKKMIAERKAQGQAELIAEMLSEGIPQTKQDLERWARDKGIPINKKPPR